MPFNLSYLASGGFVEKVRKTSARAKEYGRKQAIEHYARTAGATWKDAEGFYHDAREAFVDSKIVVNMPLADLTEFLSTGTYYKPNSDSGFNSASDKRARAEVAMGCPGLVAVYASVTQKTAGDRGYGNCSVVVSGMSDRIVLISGDSGRLRNPNRKDYVADPTLVLYEYDDMADCRAASAVMAMTVADLAGGPSKALAMIMAGDRDYGKSEALVFGKLTPLMVDEVVADGAASATAIRATLERLGKALPVVVSEDPITIFGSAEEEEESVPRPPADMLHFKTSDRVAMKPAPSNPRGLGTVTDTTNGQVTVQWDGGQRVAYDMTEALMRLMGAPGPSQRVDGMVSYSLPGMDEAAVYALSAAGIDPVTLYSVVSHARPGSAAATGWMDNMVKSLAAIGVHAHPTKGYVRNDDEHSKLAFAHGEWIEAKLPEGGRLVIDTGADKVTVRAGDVDGYIVPAHEARVAFE